MQEIWPNQETIESKLSVGDEVHVTLKDTRVFEFEIKKIDDAGITGSNKETDIFVAYSDIFKIELMETSYTIITGTLVLVGVLLIFNANKGEGIPDVNSPDL
jgi:hypothetical protein